jgi:hypothetical protein
MFSGSGYATEAEPGGFMDDMWSFNITTMLWTFWGGSNSTSIMNQKYNYGTKNVPSALNWPMARSSATGWTINDKLYVFGGQLNADVCKSPSSSVKFMLKLLMIYGPGTGVSGPGSAVPNLQLPEWAILRRYTRIWDTGRKHQPLELGQRVLIGCTMEICGFLVGLGSILL